MSTAALISVMKRAGEIFRYSRLQSQPAASVCAVVQPHCSGNGHSRGGRPDQSACFSTMRTFYLERKKKICFTGRKIKWPECNFTLSTNKHKKSQMRDFLCRAQSF